MKPSNLKSKAKASESPITFNAKIVTKRAIPRLNARQKKEAMKAILSQTGGKGNALSRII
jgi:hypothetical protein